MFCFGNEKKESTIDQSSKIKADAFAFMHTIIIYVYVYIFSDQFYFLLRNDKLNRCINYKVF